MILERKEDYYCVLSDKLNDPHTSAKSYWSRLKILYNGKKNSINTSHLNQQQTYIKR